MIGPGLRRWWADLVFGFRLSVGGSRHSRTGWVRLGLGTFGVSLAVLLLLGAASMPGVLDARTERDAGLLEVQAPRDGAPALYVQNRVTEYQGTSLRGTWAYPQAPGAPLLPGLSQHLGPGELALSPQAERLLASPAGQGLRPRFDGLTHVATIANSGLSAPGDLKFYVGASAALAKPGSSAMAVYEFGGAPVPDPLPVALVLLVVVGTVALLVPVFIFVVSSTRIAGAERDRRLAALRLVGGDAGQVRRIAAAEALLPACCGLVAGGALFAASRPLIERLRLFGTSVFAEDVVPSLPLTVLIVLAVPTLSVIAAMVAMRRMVIEPLGVVRHSKPRRRRLWWRLAVLAGGVVLLLTARELGASMPVLDDGYGRGWLGWVVVGTCLLLFGVALLLPWLVEAVISRLRGGPPSWQLAIRRLQLDSGSASRVVSGVVVVLTGAIALQLVVASIGQQLLRDVGQRAGVDIAEMRQPRMVIEADNRDPDELAATVTSVEGITGALALRAGYLDYHVVRDGAEVSTGLSFVVADCPVLSLVVLTAGCTDGDVFIRDRVEYADDPAGRHAVLPGERIRVEGTGARWTVPEGASIVSTLNPSLRWFDVDVVFTPAATRELAMGELDQRAVVLPTGPAVDAATVDQVALEQIRNAIGLVHSPPWVSGGGDMSWMTEQVSEYKTITTVLLFVSVFVLLVAAMSVLVLAIDQVRERRRALAAVAASGVGIGTLARSLLWQNAVPLAVGTLLSLAGGLVLATLVLALAGVGLHVDPIVLLSMTGTAAALVLIVTVASMPMLRAAVSVKNLRTG